MIVILKACRKEIGTFPEEIRGDLADALARLDAGLVLSMPLSRPMPDIGRGVHELRLKARSGAYRVVYALVHRGAVYGCMPSRRRRNRQLLEIWSWLESG